MNSTIAAPAGRRLTIHGAAEVGFKADPGAGPSRLAHLYHHDPLRVVFPQAASADLPQAVIVTTSGGLVGGDRLDLALTAAAATRVLFTTSAAEKVYRSAGPDSVIAVRLALGAGAWAEWLPQETILFEGARLRRETVVDLAPDARLIAGEILVFGRIRRGERMATGLVRESWRIRRDGRLIWADALHLDGDIAAILDDPACFGGAVALGTIVIAAPDPAATVMLARELLSGDVRAGATCVAGLVVVRFLGAEAQALRHAYGRVWAGLRSVLGGLPPSLPRLWSM